METVFDVLRITVGIVLIWMGGFLCGYSVGKK